MKKIILGFAIVFLFQIIGHSQWFPQNNFVQGGERIFFNENGDGYILKRIEYSSKTYLYKKFEDNWTKIYEFNSGIQGLFQVDEANWLAIFGSKLIKTTDAGYSWETIFESSEMNFRSIYFKDESNYWATADKLWSNKSLILKSTDKGETWETILLSSDHELFTGIFFIDQQVGFVYGYSEYKTTDGGITWNHFDSPDFYQVENINDSTFYVLTFNNELYKTIDRGNSYTLIYSDPNRFIRYIYFKDELNGFLAGDPGNYLMKTTDGGISWVEVVCDFEYDLNEIYMLNDSNVWAIDDQNIYISYDGGMHWQLTPFSGKELCKVILYSKNNLFAVGGTQSLSNDASILILKTTDSGTNWKIVQSELRGKIYSASFIDSLTAWFVGYNTKLIKTSDGGNSFEVIDPGIGETYYDIKFLNKNIGWAVGDSGLIVKTTNGGNSWFSLSFSTSNQLEKIIYLDTNNIYIYARWDYSQPGFVIKSSDDGNNWNVVVSNLYSNDLHVFDSLKWRDTDYDLVRETLDGGKTWQILWENSSYGYLGKINFIDEFNGYMLTGYWSILKTVNGGIDWAHDVSLDFYPYDLEFVDTSTGWVLGYGTEIYKTITGGGGIVAVFEEPNEANFLNTISLSQNYPNPFNPSTTISWQSPVGSWQTIKLFNALGQEVDTIVDEYLPAGFHSKLYIVNSTLPSGVYFYRLKAGDYVQTKKMLLIK